MGSRRCDFNRIHEAGMPSTVQMYRAKTIMGIALQWKDFSRTCRRTSRKACEIQKIGN